MIQGFFTNNTYQLVDSDKYELKIKDSWKRERIKQYEAIIELYEDRILSIANEIKAIKETLEENKED